MFIYFPLSRFTIAFNYIVAISFYTVAQQVWVRTLGTCRDHRKKVQGKRCIFVQYAKIPLNKIMKFYSFNCIEPVITRQ